MLVDVNALSKRNQSEDHVNVGIDIGGSVWEVRALDHRTGKSTAKRFQGRMKGVECAEWMMNRYSAADRQVTVVYEAGRCGYWPARMFQSIGAETTIIPMNKLEIVRFGKRVKTDRLDAEFLSKLDPISTPRLPSVYIPTMSEEERRSMLRERDRLSEDIRRSNQRMLSIIDRFPIQMQLEKEKHRKVSEWEAILADWLQEGYIGKKLPNVEYERLGLLLDQLKLLEKQRNKWDLKVQAEELRVKEDAGRQGVTDAVSKLVGLRGIGDTSARKLCWYIGNFERFPNGRKLGSYFGLTPTHHSSGRLNREQGISKAGNGEIRRIAIQLAWLWQRHQPDSWLTKKWHDRLSQKGRCRRTAIVAFARQLMVALYRYIVHDEPIEGAMYN